MDRVTLRRFVLTFSWALEALQLETKEIWSPDELKWPRLLRDGGKIPDAASIRIIQDRLARVCQSFFFDLLDNEKAYWSAVEEVKKRIFSAPLT